MVIPLVFSLFFFNCYANPLYWPSRLSDSRNPLAKPTYFRQSARAKVPFDSSLTQILLCPFDALYDCTNSSDPLLTLENDSFGSNFDAVVDIQSPDIGGSDDSIGGLILQEPRNQLPLRRLEGRCMPRCDYNKDWLPIINLHPTSNRGTFTTPPANNKYKSLYNINMAKDYSDIFLANSYGYYGKREQPLFVDEPQYMVLDDDRQDRHLLKNGKDDPFIPPRGRKNSPLFESLRHGGDVFIPNRGRKDKLSDIFKYDDTFFPNRGKKDAVDWPDFKRNEPLMVADAKKQVSY